MSEAPIFDDLIVERRFSPFRELDWPPPDWWLMPTPCPICGTIDASRFPVDEYDDPICMECWQCNRHLKPEAWHCADCGKFLRGLDRCQVVVGNRVVPVCAEHMQQRRKPA